MVKSGVVNWRVTRWQCVEENVCPSGWKLVLIQRPTNVSGLPNLGEIFRLKCWPFSAVIAWRKSVTGRITDTKHPIENIENKSRLKICRWIPCPIYEDFLAEVKVLILTGNFGCFTEPRKKVTTTPPSWCRWRPGLDLPPTHPTLSLSTWTSCKSSKRMSIWTRIGSGYIQRSQVPRAHFADRQHVVVHWWLVVPNAMGEF